jgi:hypothetical protein
MIIKSFGFFRRETAEDTVLPDENKPSARELIFFNKNAAEVPSGS